ncbi:MAG TPA: hypothetical protein PLL06_21050 [Acidobacteriota bacterium]|nr:hypothetical protein [Acidobacteriota bacterium]HMZ82199.1 hypothetical protein [Acidobacteriota bacterium]HND18895.1 hypothetical protein [Acidobacteriota bacterium]HNG93844.1 hypothetical protein [Acidobacteriota bacterium]HNH82079.1 hypothetical protein [Acidobacteriota bacterium]
MRILLAMRLFQREQTLFLSGYLSATEMPELLKPGNQVRCLVQMVKAAGFLAGGELSWHRAAPICVQGTGKRAQRLAISIKNLENLMSGVRQVCEIPTDPK